MFVSYVMVRVTRFEHATTASQTQSSTRLSYTRKTSGAPGVNRTPDLGLQNRCFTTRTNGAVTYLFLDSNVLIRLRIFDLSFARLVFPSMSFNCTKLSGPNLGLPVLVVIELLIVFSFLNWLRGLDLNQGWQRLMRPRW